ncbi:MAG: hypothetical protein QOD39_4578 [Mycobacterium sp.]|jgi:hypothetical protein|nr:hypothetical protein [Mycobacterium sp.]
MSAGKGESIQQRAVEVGVLTAADAAATVARLVDSDVQVFTPVMMAGISRRV